MGPEIPEDTCSIYEGLSRTEAPHPGLEAWEFTVVIAVSIAGTWILWPEMPDVCGIGMIQTHFSKLQKEVLD